MHNQYLESTNSIVIEKNKVLKNTYLLLGCTLLLSTGTAAFSAYINAPYPSLVFFLAGAWGLMFLTHALKDSAWGLLSAFCFTGFMGYTLGPLLNSVLTLSNGGAIVSMALGSTAIIFLGLSAHVIISGKDYSYLGGFLFVAIMIAFLSMLGSFVFNLPALSLAVSAAFILISSGMILFKTSQIINGGERNYIVATISLYVSIYNLFVSLLRIFSALSGRN